METSNENTQSSLYVKETSAIRLAHAIECVDGAACHMHSDTCLETVAKVADLGAEVDDACFSDTPHKTGFRLAARISRAAAQAIREEIAERAKDRARKSEEVTE